ncbi:hypothetical protein ABNF97_27605 [Plantactinospora sp. B6F1]|uniref:hypothetical protein n=1 Tax=Plantactinospora sp. B6F1 TaxID=3158971 RepID=UPI0032D98884
MRGGEAGAAPLALVMVVSGPERPAIRAAWSDADELTADLIVLDPAEDGWPGTPGPSTLAGSTGGGPYAVFASGPVVHDTVAAIAGLSGNDRPVRLFIAHARPPVWRPERPPMIHVPCGVLSGLRDQAAPPVAMAGWRRHCAGPFSLQVFDADGGFLGTHSREALSGILEDLRMMPTQAPGRGFRKVRVDPDEPTGEAR